MPGERQHCSADTSAVALLRSTSGVCLLRRTWGYDDTGIWVSDGCWGEFTVGYAGVAATPATGAQSPSDPKPADRIETWGEFNPGQGFLVGRSGAGELVGISAYALIRYINQMPGTQTFTDHLGIEHTVDGRNDFFPHRIMVFLKGCDRQSETHATTYSFWTVNPTDQKNVWPWATSSRVALACMRASTGCRDAFAARLAPLLARARPRDGRRVFPAHIFERDLGAGRGHPGLWYNVIAPNNLSALGIKGTQLDRRWGTGGSMWWMPTTHELAHAARMGIGNIMTRSRPGSASPAATPLQSSATRIPIQA